MKPVLIVVAGPNGSGKTTITARLRGDKWSLDVEYLNPDDVARDRFGDWDSPDAVRQAAEWTERRREELLRSNASLAFETVLSRPDKLDFMRRAANQGYFVRVFFVGTSSPTINASRVAQRMLEGGHSVPIEKILTRYTKSIANLGPAIALADRTYLYDNSIGGVDARLCARFVDGQVRKLYPGEIPEWVSQSLEDIELHAQYEDLRAAVR